jgi:MOSC domain-containing protein YiiM
METLEKNIAVGSVEVCGLYISAGHNFFGHHGKPPGQHPMLEMDEIECIAGRGIRGDRFFDHQKNYKGQITFFAQEIYEALCEELGVRDKSLAVIRRNAITIGVDLNELIGEEFQIQGIHFRGTEECRPCYWMDQAFAPGAFDFLKGRGGLRAEILSNGILRRMNG